MFASNVFFLFNINDQKKKKHEDPTNVSLNDDRMRVKMYRMVNTPNVIRINRSMCDTICKHTVAFLQ